VACACAYPDTLELSNLLRVTYISCRYSTDRPSDRRSTSGATCAYTSADGRACRNAQSTGVYCVHHTCDGCGDAKQSRATACESCLATSAYENWDVIGGGGGGGHRGVAASAPAVAVAKLPVDLDPTEWEWPEATVCPNEFPLLRLRLRGYL
jgi:hypothetical protein